MLSTVLVWGILATSSHAVDLDRCDGLDFRTMRQLTIDAAIETHELTPLEEPAQAHIFAPEVGVRAWSVFSEIGRSDSSDDGSVALTSRGELGILVNLKWAFPRSGRTERMNWIREQRLRQRQRLQLSQEIAGLFERWRHAPRGSSEFVQLKALLDINTHFEFSQRLAIKERCVCGGLPSLW